MDLIKKYSEILSRNIPKLSGLASQAKSFVQKYPSPGAFVASKIGNIPMATQSEGFFQTTPQRLVPKQDIVPLKEFLKPKSYVGGPAGKAISSSINTALPGALPMMSGPANAIKYTLPGIAKGILANASFTSAQGLLEEGKPRIKQAFSPGNIAFGLVFSGLDPKSKTASVIDKKAISTIQKGYGREVRALVGKFAEMVEMNPGANRKNMGDLGDYIQSLAETTFGKKVSNLTNRQLVNLFDYAMKEADSGGGTGAYSFGLSTQNIRQGTKKATPATKGVGEVKNFRLRSDIDLKDYSIKPISNPKVGSYAHSLVDEAAFFKIKEIEGENAIIQQVDNLRGRNPQELVYRVPIKELSSDYMQLKPSVQKKAIANVRRMYTTPQPPATKGVGEVGGAKGPTVKTTKPAPSALKLTPVQPTKISVSSSRLPETPSQGLTPQTPPPVPPGTPPRPGMTPSVPKKASSQQEWTYSIKDRLYTEFVDRFNPVSKLAKISGKGGEMRGRIAQYYGSGATADYHLNYELSPILKDHDLKDLRQAAVAMRDVELAGRKIQGSPAQGKAAEVLAGLQKKYGDEGMRKMGEGLKKLYQYQEDILRKYLVDTGIISEASFAEMKRNNNFYVPFKRVSDKMDEFMGIPTKKGAGSVGKQNVVFKIKGSDKDIIDPIESIVENTYKAVSLGQRQRVAQIIAGISRELPDLVKRVKTGDARNTIGLFEKGKKVFYEVPEEVADAARGMSEEQLVMLAKILKVPTDLFRTMTTGVNPEFLLPNISRDVQSALFNAGVNPLKWVAGLAHYIKKDQVYRDFLQAGGRTARVSLNRPYITQTAKEVAGQGFSIKSPKDIVRGLEMLSQFSEQPTRINVFNDALKRGIKNGLSREDALREAAYWAQEGTVNFARRGSKMTNINAVYAYLNARIQGVDRMFRTLKNEPGKATARLAFGFLAPSVALYAWNSQFEDYNNERILSKRDKQDNFIFMLPKPVGGVRYLKLPKSEIGKVVNPVEEFFDFARGKESDVVQSVGNIIKSFLPIDNWGGVIPTAVNPIVENAFNKDFYTGYDLVPDYKENYPPAYQTSTYTSPLYRVAGEKINVSPAKLQNLVEGYGGGLAKFADLTVNKFIPDEYKTAKNMQGAEINRTPILRRFMGGEKKTEQEQIIADEKRVNAINFDINDIKGGMKRGEIPFEAGQKEITKLQEEQTRLLGGTSSGDTDMDKLRFQVSGKKMDIIGTNLYYTADNGDTKTIDLTFQPTPPVKTGLELLDKKAVTGYKSDITKKSNDIVKMYELGVLSANEAENLLKELDKAYQATKGPKKPKKPTFKKLTAPKIKKITLKKPKIPKIKVAKAKKYKLKKVKLSKVKLKGRLT